MAQDLFGSEVTEVTIDPQQSFKEFWDAYPSGDRRTAKPKCIAYWIKNNLEREAEQIIAHVHHMKTEDSWVRGFHPMTMTYLNQRRWMDWTPSKAPQNKQQALESSNDAVLRNFLAGL